MTSSRGLFCFITAVLLATSSIQAGKRLKRAEARELVSVARQSWSIEDEGDPPFRYSGAVSVTVPGKKPLQGEHSYAWEDPGHWRYELILPGFWFVASAKVFETGVGFAIVG